MANDVFTDITIINNSGFFPGLPSAQSGMEVHSLKLSYKPQINRFSENYQGANVRKVVGPVRLEGDISGDLVYPSLTGIGAADFVTAFVFDIAFPDIGGAAIGGGNYFESLDVDFEAKDAKEVTISAKFSNDKNIP